MKGLWKQLKKLWRWLRKRKRSHLRTYSVQYRPEGVLTIDRTDGKRAEAYLLTRLGSRIKALYQAAPN